WRAASLRRTYGVPERGRTTIRVPGPPRVPLQPGGASRRGRASRRLRPRLAPWLRARFPCDDQLGRAHLAAPHLGARNEGRRTEPPARLSPALGCDVGRRERPRVRVALGCAGPGAAQGPEVVSGQLTHHGRLGGK